MSEEQIVRHIHENKEARPDSIEIGSPSKGGVIKVYFNASMPKEEIQKLIDAAFDARAYANSKVGSP
jgi:hypothetical protein